MDTTPIMLKFDGDIEFRKVMSDNAYEIHSRTLYGIDKAFKLNTTDDVILAYLNHADSMLGIPKDCWLDNLEMTLDFFISIEDYTKCQEVKELMDKLKNEDTK
mgnify:CR=1 FL=1